jgi:hypothetical protein
MSTMTKIVLSAVFLLGIALEASAATGRGPVTQAYSSNRSSVPQSGERCTTSGGPECFTGCLPSGPPCRLHPDTW